MVNPRTGKTDDAPIIKFTDGVGDPCFCWGTYQLTEALENVTVGSMVRITSRGLKDIGGGRTVNRYKVEVKSA